MLLGIGCLPSYPHLYSGFHVRLSSCLFVCVWMEKHHFQHTHTYGLPSMMYILTVIQIVDFTRLKYCVPYSSIVIKHVRHWNWHIWSSMVSGFFQQKIVSACIWFAWITWSGYASSFLILLFFHGINKTLVFHLTHIHTSCLFIILWYSLQSHLTRTLHNIICWSVAVPWLVCFISFAFCFVL